MLLPAPEVHKNEMKALLVFVASRERKSQATADQIFQSAKEPKAWDRHAKGKSLAVSGSN